jgi:hypothetical protein
VRRTGDAIYLISGGSRTVGWVWWNNVLANETRGIAVRGDVGGRGVPLIFVVPTKHSGSDDGGKLVAMIAVSVCCDLSSVGLWVISGGRVGHGMSR